MRRHVNIAVIVFVIAFFLFGLVWPAIQMVQEAAKRMQCQNRCKQLGLAWHNYYDANGHTVPGTYPNPNLPPEQRFSWCHEIMPHIEAMKGYPKVDLSLSWDDPRNTPRTHIHLGYFTCLPHPSQPTPLETSYLGVAGVGADAAKLSADDPRIGAFRYDRTLTIDKFTDGQSNTMLLLETLSGGPWAQGGPGTVRGLDPNDRPHHGYGRPFDDDHRISRGFKRTKTITLTWCDGSVRAVRDSVNPEVLEALVTVRGKEEVRGEW
jgi:hypothetical protein